MIKSTMSKVAHLFEQERLEGLLSEVMLTRRARDR